MANISNNVTDLEIKANSSTAGVNDLLLESTTGPLSLPMKVHWDVNVGLVICCFILILDTFTLIYVTR